MFMVNELALNEFYHISKLNESPDNDYQLNNLGYERSYGSFQRLRSQGGGWHTTMGPVRKEDYDSAFVAKLLRINPPYELDQLVNYHFDYYIKKGGSREKFVNHIEFVTLPYLEKHYEKQKPYIELTKQWVNKHKPKNYGMIEYYELEPAEHNAINTFIQSVTPELLASSYLWFQGKEIAGLFTENATYHSERVFRFLQTNDFVRLRTHEPSFEFLEKGRTLLKYGSIEKYYEKQNHIMGHNTNVNGNNNLVTIASGNVSMSNVSITISEQHYKELEALGVDQQDIQELKEIEVKHKNDKPGFIQAIGKFSGKVIQAVAVKQLVDNLPAINKIFMDLIHQHS